MNDKLKSKLTNAYMMFIFDFHDPLSVDKVAIEKRMPCKLEEMFSGQRLADRTKRRLQADFPKALSLYFVTFQVASGVDIVNLQADISAHERVMRRHLGKDKMNYLLLIVTLLKELDHMLPYKGLLSEHAA